MNKKDLNFKSVIFKIFFTYLGVYFLALIFKYTYDLESLFNNLECVVKFNLEHFTK